jgi:phage tail protein X
MQVEKYIPKRINLETAPEGIEVGGDRSFIPGDMIDAVCCRMFGHGANNVLKSVKGNVLKNYPGLSSSGTNKVIGTFHYEKENSLVYHIYNSLGNHQVVEYNPDTDTFTKLLEGAYLAYQSLKTIDQGGFVDDLHIWNDRVNPIRKFNLVRARTGFYLGDASKKILFGATPPLDIPTFAIATDNTQTLNFCSASNFQFTYNFIYLDNEESAFSPLSKLARGVLLPKVTTQTGNLINVTVTIPDYLIGLIKTVQVAYREGNAGEYFIFHNIENPTLTSYQVPFRNNDRKKGVPTVLQNKYYDRIPRRTDGFALIKNRAIVVRNSEGFDIPNTFGLSVSLLTEEASFTVSGGRRDYGPKKYLKGGGTYGIGIIFGEDQGKTSFVKTDQYLNIPEDAYIDYTASVNGANWKYIGLSSNVKRYLFWSLTGTPPEGATWYQIVLTKEKRFSYYSQGLGIAFIYHREMSADDKENTIDNFRSYFNWRGKVFVERNAAVVLRGKSLYLQIPTNLPIVPQVGDIVNIKTPFSNDTSEQTTRVVQNIFGDLLDLGKIGTNSITASHLFFELYRPATSKEDVFYEIGEKYPISGGNFTTLNGTIYGDTSLVSL